MNDATPWIDPELVAAGQLLQSRGLVAPDRTQASLERGARRDRPHRSVSRRRVRPAPARAGSELAGTARPGAVPPLSAGQCRKAAADDLRAWRRLHAGQPAELGCDAARTRPPERGRRAVGRLPPVARAPVSGGLRRDGRDGPPRCARGRRASASIRPGSPSAAIPPAPTWRWQPPSRCAMPASVRSASCC